MCYVVIQIICLSSPTKNVPYCKNIYRTKSKKLLDNIDIDRYNITIPTKKIVGKYYQKTVGRCQFALYVMRQFHYSSNFDTCQWVWRMLLTARLPRTDVKSRLCLDFSRIKWLINRLDSLTTHTLRLE